MKISSETICKAIIRGDWTPRELALLRDAIRTQQIKNSDATAKRLCQFPYARLRGVAPKSRNGTMVCILSVCRNVVTYRDYNQERTQRLPLHCFEPLM